MKNSPSKKLESINVNDGRKNQVKGKKGDVNEEKIGFWSELARCTIFKPTFYFAALVQASATPICEFQSQLPLWLSMDKSLSSTEIGLGVTAWHAGIFFSVILFGIFFDKAKSDVHKGCLLAAPMFCNFVLFSLIMNDFNTIDERSQIFAGALKKVIVV